jgi:putative FmdB family regulatory protein
MPTYDYRCDACGHEFERFQSITAPAVRRCPKCGRLKVRRLIGAGGGILFRGKGFYQTDYRSESYRKAAEKEKPGGEGKSGGEGKAGEGGSGGAGKPPAKDKAKDGPSGEG